MLRRFRYQLYQRMLLFPLSYFSEKTRPPDHPMITQSAIHWAGSSPKPSIPRLPGGAAADEHLLMFMQDPILGFAAVALYPVRRAM